MSDSSGSLNFTGSDQACERREVVLARGEHRWIFKCEPGCEPALIERLTQIADDPDCPFDAHDAAVVRLVLEGAPIDLIPAPAPAGESPQRPSQS